MASAWLFAALGAVSAVAGAFGSSKKVKAAKITKATVDSDAKNRIREAELAASEKEKAREHDLAILAAQGQAQEVSGGFDLGSAMPLIIVGGLALGGLMLLKGN